MTQLILASASVIRQTILENAGLSFSQATAPIDERAIEKTLHQASPSDVAMQLAIAKAAAVSHANPKALVIGADQVLDHEGEILHKAGNRCEAESKLARLQGSTHHLVAGVALVRDGHTLWRHAAKANLTMRQLNEAERKAYLDNAGDAAILSVGAYRLEERGAALFSQIEGDYFTILGLPLLPLLQALRDQGIDPLLAKEANR